MSMTKLTGVVTLIRCPKCGEETEEFGSSNKARNWAYKTGWVKIGTTFVCPKCSKLMGLHKRYYVKELDGIK